MSQKAWIWPGRYPKMVKRMLMSKSQLQPVIIAAAAGGKMMATRMITMSEPRTGILIVVQAASW